MRRGVIMCKRRGFTLVELLVVIAIIALLMSILMPSLAKVKLQAKSVACMSNLSQWGKIFLMYSNDQDGYFMHGWYGRPGNPNAQRESWPHALRSAVDIRERQGLGFCPMTSWKDLKKKLLAFIEYFNKSMAKPFKWTYQGKPLEA